MKRSSQPVKCVVNHYHKTQKVNQGDIESTASNANPKEIEKGRRG
jgi:hypothetical protein